MKYTRYLFLIFVLLFALVATTLVIRRNDTEYRSSVADQQDALPFLSRSAINAAKIESRFFTMTIPEDWIVRESENSERNDDGRLIYGWISNEEFEDEQVRHGLVWIELSDVMKNGRTLGQIASSYGLMSAYPGLSSQTGQQQATSVNETATTIDDHEALRQDAVCEKPCASYGIEIVARVYFIEAGDRIFILRAQTGAGERAQSLMIVSDEIMKLFNLRD